MDKFVDWGITFNAVGKLFFFCCFGGITSGRSSATSVLLLKQNCCSCLVCKRRISSMTSIKKEENLYICPNQFPESHQSLNCVKQEPDRKAGIDALEMLSKGVVSDEYFLGAK